MIEKSDDSYKLEGWTGSITIPSTIASSLVVGFKDHITIKQEGNIDSKMETLQLESQTEKTSIIFDSTVTVENQAFTLTSARKATEVTIYSAGETLDDQQLSDIITVPEGSDVTLSLQKGVTFTTTTTDTPTTTDTITTPDTTTTPSSIGASVDTSIDSTTTTTNQKGFPILYIGIIAGAVVIIIVVVVVKKKKDDFSLGTVQHL